VDAAKRPSLRSEARFQDIPDKGAAPRTPPTASPTGRSHRTCRWLHGQSQVRKEERKYLGSLSTRRPPRRTPIHYVPWSLGASGLAGPVTIVWLFLPACSLKKALVSLFLPDLAELQALSCSLSPYHHYPPPLGLGIYPSSIKSHPPLLHLHLLLHIRDISTRPHRYVVPRLPS